MTQGGRYPLRWWSQTIISIRAHVSFIRPENIHSSPTTCCVLHYIVWRTKRGTRHTPYLQGAVRQRFLKRNGKDSYGGRAEVGAGGLPGHCLGQGRLLGEGTIWVLWARTNMNSGKKATLVKWKKNLEFSLRAMRNKSFKQGSGEI